jgi:hypothetical protein
MTYRSCLPAIEALKLCQAALERILPAEERHIILGVHKQALMRLEQLARNDDARMARLDQVNQDKRPTADQVAAERAHVMSLCDIYRANLKGRFSREGVMRWICAKSQIPKKRVLGYLKEIPHGRGDGLPAQAIAQETITSEID